MEEILRDKNLSWKEEALAETMLTIIQKLEELEEEVEYLKSINRDNIT